MGYSVTAPAPLSSALPRRVPTRRVARPRRARRDPACSQEPLRGPIHKAISGYRYYNPDVGRWVSRDPIEEDGGFNVYAFVLNDPITGYDIAGLRKATAIERRFWLGFTWHPLQRKLWNRYMDDTAEELVLSIDDVRALKPSPGPNYLFQPYYSRKWSVLLGIGTSQCCVETKYTDGKYLVGVGPGGVINTLGRFFIQMEGEFCLNGRDVTFNGTFKIDDDCDFDLKNMKGRSIAGKLKTLIGRYAMPGSAFPVTSDAIPIHQDVLSGQDPSW